MNKILYTIVCILFLSAAHSIQAQTLVTDPPDGHYCEGQAGVEIKIENSVQGQSYSLIKQGTPGSQSDVTGNGGTVTFPGPYFPMGNYYTQPATNSVTVTRDSRPGNQNIIVSDEGMFCNYPNATGILISLSGSNAGIEYTLTDPNNVPTVIIGPGGGFSFGYYTLAGNYTVIAENTTTGCTRDLGSVEVIPLDPPTANFTAAPQNQCASVPVAFTNLSSGTGELTYLWNFDDPNSGTKNTSTLFEPSHTFEAWGNGTETFDVTLIVTDENGCEDEITITVSVEQKPDASLAATGSNISSNTENDTTTFAYCGAENNAVFTFQNITSTSSSNTHYTIVWGDGTPDYSSATFDAPIDHTYYGLGFKTLYFTIDGDNGCSTTKKYYIFIGSTPSGGIVNPGGLWGNSPFLVDIPISDETYDNTPGTKYVIDWGDGSDVLILYQNDLPESKILQHEYVNCSDQLDYCLNPNDLRYTFKATCVATNPCDNAYSIVCPIYVSCPVEPNFGGSDPWGNTWGANPGEIIACNPVTFSNMSIPGFYINNNGGGFSDDTYYEWDFGDPASGTNNTSNLAEPTHEFTNSCQEYTVTLTAYTGDNIGNNSGIVEISKQVFIQEPPEANFDMQVLDNNCIPTQVQISNTSDIGCFGVPLYTWTIEPEAGWTIINGNHLDPEPLFQFNTSSKYYITLEIENSCGIATKLDSIQICEPPTAEFDEDVYLQCDPGQHQFAPDYALNCTPSTISYLWTVTGPSPINFVAPTNEFSASPIIEFIDFGDYNVTVNITNSCGFEESTQTVTVTQSLDNNIITSITPEICVGMASITIDGETPTGGMAPFTYIWEQRTVGSPNWTPIPGATDEDLTISLSETTWFRRWAYDDGECSSVSNEEEITVYPAIQNNVILDDQQSCMNSQPELITGTDAFGGNDPISYQWEESDDGIIWTSIVGATNLDYQPGILNSTKYYRREAISAPCESVFSNTVTIDVCSPISNNTIWENQTICEGTTPIEFTGSMPDGSCGYFSYQWQYKTDVMPDFVDIPTATIQNFQALSLTEKTFYRRVVVSEICPDDFSNEITIDIWENPTANAGPDQPLANGASANLTAIASGGTPPYVSYHWEPAGLINGSPDLSTVTTVPLNATTTFTVCVTDQNGCTDCDEINVIIEGDPLSIEIDPQSLEICPGTPAEICVTASGGTGNYTYSWLSNPPGFTSDQNCINIIPSATTNYTVTVFDGWSTVTASAPVTVLPLPTIEGNLFAEICSGYMLAYEPESSIPGSNFLWTTLPVANISGNTNGSGLSIDNTLINTGNDIGIVHYEITPISPQGCTGLTETLVVHVLPHPQITNTITQQTSVSGQPTLPVTFTSNVLGVNYQWDFVSTDCPGLIDFQLTSGDTQILPEQIITILPGAPPTCILTYEVTAWLVTPQGLECWGTPSTYEFYVNSEPTQFNLICPGSICSGESTTVSLSGSESGVEYLLLRNGSIPILPVQPGTGNQLDWSNITMPGNYFVRATNLSNGQISMMEGFCTIEVNPLPAIYELTSLGEEHCSPVTLRLSGSQIDVDYQLIQNNISVIDTKTGDGNPIDFNPITLIGTSETFTVHAINPFTGCERDMTGTITADPSPQEFAIFPGGIICEGVTLCIDGWEDGVEYQLWKDDDPFSAFVSGTSGEPTLCFDPPTDGPGIYRIFAQYPDPVDPCGLFFTESQIVHEKPLLFNMSPDVCCPGCEIILEGCQEGITYELWFDPPTDEEPELAGALTVELCDPDFPVLNFGTFWDEGIYTVKAISENNCVSWMNDQTIIKAAPTVFNMNPDGWSCPEVEITLDNSEEGVEYRLLKNGNWNPTDFVIGPAGGGSISFGLFSDNGVYTSTAVLIHDDGLECWSNMNGSYEIREFPIAYLLSPEPGIYCPCQEVMLNGSEVGIEYFLLNSSTGTQSIGIPGTGGAITWTNICEPGDYYAIGKNILDPELCKTPMEGSFTISPSPETFEVLSSASPPSYCEGSAGIDLKLSGSQTTVVEYQLYKVVNPGPDQPVSTAISGTGAELIWTNISAGEYYVVAVYVNDPTCPVEMNNRIVVEEIPLPIAYINEQEAICTGECFDLEIIISGNGPWDISYTTQDTENGLLTFNTVVNTMPHTINMCPIVPTTYTLSSVKLSLAPYCEGLDLGNPVLVDVIDNPEVFAGDDGTICFNNTYTIPSASVNHAGDFSWSITQGFGTLDDNTLINPSYSPGNGDAGTTVIITLSASGEFECGSEIVSDVVNIQVEPNPEIVSAQSITICSGEAINYTPVSDLTNATYSWNYIDNTGGCIVRTAVSNPDIISDILINTCNEIKSVSYTITPVGPAPTFCPGQEFTLLVSVNPTPHITNSNDEQFINSGETSQQVNFTSDVIGTETTYQWTGIESISELEGWIESGNTNHLPQMPISIVGNPPLPEQGEVTYTVIPYVNECAGTPFEYTIHVYLMPSIYQLSGGGEYCDDGQTCLNIILASSQFGINYELLDSDGLLVPGSFTPGTGNALSWCISAEGTYSVLATNPNTSVQELMNGSIEIIPLDLPQVLTLYPTEPTCPNVEFYLNGSQENAKYTLHYQDGTIMDTQYGTGNGFIEFANQSLAGDYFVRASVEPGPCDTIMDSIGTIIELPHQYNITPGPNGNYCVSDNITIGLAGSDPNITYHLQLYGAGNNPQATTQGTGDAIIFSPNPPNLEPGSYLVKAVSTITGCFVYMYDTLQIFANPHTFNITADGMAIDAPADTLDFCPNIEIGLSWSESDVRYRLFYSENPNHIAEVYGIDGVPPSFGIFNDPGFYHVEARNLATTCAQTMHGVIKISNGPTKFTLICENSLYCEGETTQVSITQLNSQPLVLYELLKSGIPSGAPQIIGDGNPILWENVSQYGEGEYTVKATFQFDPLCSAIMNPTEGIPIFELETPTAALAGDTTICSGDTAFVPLTLTGEWLDYIISYKMGNVLQPEDTIPFIGPHQIILPNIYQDTFIELVSITYLNTYTNSTMCDGTVSGSYQINTDPLPEIFAGADASACSGIPILIADATIEHASDFHWLQPEPNSAGIFDNHFVASPTFTANNSAGNSEVRLILEAFGSGACNYHIVSDTLVLWVDSIPNVIAPSDTTICSTEVLNLTGFAQNYTNILWQDQSGLGSFTPDDNLLTQYSVINPEDILVPTYVILELSADGVGACINQSISETFVVDIIPEPHNVFAGSDTLICASTEIFNLTQATAEQYQEIFWSTTGNGTFEASNNLATDYYIDENDRLEGSIELCLTALPLLPCKISVTECLTLDFEPMPISDLGNDTTVCINMLPFQLTSSFVSAQNYDSLQWYGGDGYFNNSNDLNPSYTPGYSDSLLGIIDLCLTTFANSPCTLQDSTQTCITLTIQKLPVPIPGNDTLICEDTPLHLINSMAENYENISWTTSNGDGSFDDPSLVNPTYTLGPNDVSNQPISLCMLAQAISPCLIDSVNCMDVYIQQSPFIGIPGGDGEYCESQGFYPLNGEANFHTGAVWTTSSTSGIFADTFALSTNYYPSMADLEAGNVALCLTVQPTNPCTTSIDSCINLALYKLPQVDAGQNACICESSLPFSLDALAENYTAVEWFCEPDIGTFSNGSILNPSFNLNGSVEEPITVNLIINVTGEGACLTESIKDTLTLQIDPLPSAFAGSDTVICINDEIQIPDADTSYTTNFISWEIVSGNGTLYREHKIDPVYDPDESDAGTTVILQLNVEGNNCCSNEVSTSQVQIDVIGLPEISFTNENPVGVMCISDSDGFTIPQGYVSVSNYSELMWIVDHENPPPGYIIDSTETTLAPTFIPYPYAAGTTVKLRLNATGNEACGGATTEDYFYIKIGTEPYIEINEPESSCPNSELGFSITDLTTNYHPDQTITSINWFVDGSPAGDGTEILHHTFTLPGTYVIGVELETTIEDSTACSGSSTLELTIYEPPEAGFKWEMIDLCHREVKFTDTTNAIIENNSWAIWDVASGELLMERENEESFSYQFASGGLKTVQLIVSDDKGCLDTIVRENLIIDNGFDFTIKYERSCFGEPIIFSVENIIPNTISNVNWEWKFHDGTIILNPESQFTYGQEGEYLVLLTAIFNEECLIQKDTTLYIQAPHLPEISIDTCYGPEVSFIGIPNNNLDLYASWEWLFGDKTSETITQITDPVFVLHQYANDSTYDVKLVIVDTLGCSDTIHLNGIRTFCDEQMGLWIPNAFAPDATEQVGDARYFMPKGNGIEEFEIKVFDLWGNQVWESSANGNPDEYWDGKYKNTNRDMPAGTYLFKAYARFKDGTVWQDDNGNNSGTILLIR